MTSLAMSGFEYDVHTDTSSSKRQALTSTQMQTQALTTTRRHAVRRGSCPTLSRDSLGLGTDSVNHTDSVLLDRIAQLISQVLLCDEDGDDRGAPELSGGGRKQWLREIYATNVKKGDGYGKNKTSQDHQRHDNNNNGSDSDSDNDNDNDNENDNSNEHNSANIDGHRELHELDGEDGDGIRDREHGDVLTATPVTKSSSGANGDDLHQRDVGVSTAPSDETRVERMLRHKLAQVLLELAREKENLQLAASAGADLISQLETTRAQHTAMQEQAATRQVELETAQRDAQRLRTVCAEMESELRHYDTAWAEMDEKQRLARQAAASRARHGRANGNDSADDSDSDGNILDRRRSRRGGDATHLVRHDSRRGLMLANHQESLSGGTPDSGATTPCATCENHLVDLTSLEHTNDTLTRRCMALELQHDKMQSSWTELSKLHKKNEGCLKRIQADYSKALTDIEFMATQIKYMKTDHCNLITARDTLRSANRRLQAEKEELATALEESRVRVAHLEQGKTTAVMHGQILENRVSSLVRANEVLVLERERQEQQLKKYEQEACERVTTYSALQQHTRDLEELLGDATRHSDESAHGKRDHEIQNASHVTDAPPGHYRRRRMSTWDGVTTPEISVADVIALGMLERERAHIANSGSGAIDPPNVESSNGSGHGIGDSTIVTPVVELDARSCAAHTLAANHVDHRSSPTASMTSTGSLVEHHEAATRPRKHSYTRRPSLVYMRPLSASRRVSASSDEAAHLLKRKFSRRQLRRRRQRRSISEDSTSGDGTTDTEGNSLHSKLEEEKPSGISTTPLYLGLSFIACASAVRYIVKR